MNADYVITLLREGVVAAGTKKDFAREIGISPQYLNDVLLGRRDPGQSILDALGLERRVTYHPSKGRQTTDQPPSKGNVMAQRYAFGTHESGTLTLFWVEEFDTLDDAKSKARKTLDGLYPENGLIAVERRLVRDGSQVLMLAHKRTPDDADVLPLNPGMEVAVFESFVREDLEAA